MTNNYKKNKLLINELNILLFIHVLFINYVQKEKKIIKKKKS